MTVLTVSYIFFSGSETSDKHKKMITFSKLWTHLQVTSCKKKKKSWLPNFAFQDLQQFFPQLSMISVGCLTLIRSNSQNAINCQCHKLERSSNHWCCSTSEGALDWKKVVLRSWTTVRAANFLAKRVKWIILRFSNRSNKSPKEEKSSRLVGCCSVHSVKFIELSPVLWEKLEWWLFRTTCVYLCGQHL